MATRLFSASSDRRAEADSNLTVTEAVGSATVTTDIELTVDLATTPSRERVLVALERMRDYILQINWPPV